MKKLLLLPATLLLLSACAGSVANRQEATPQIDSLYSEAVIDSMISKDDSLLTQTDYSTMIEQCRQINSRVAESLSNYNFTTDMTDEEMEAVVARMSVDSTLQLLDHQSRELFLRLQQADLNEGNRQRYASMVAAADSLLRQLR